MERTIIIPADCVRKIGAMWKKSPGSSQMGGDLVDMLMSYRS